ncbi:hypothetical protein BT96DRAFT_1006533 [Gymnopus androsaceus JB14]|uniref:Uncharacterized protein n=1 Tax=Gymnopus androsaceus JB14 TaxID=1447944 RepID=A0A6A4GKA6_9AGAR|nr:hypothetical protein BT96DRAFT_1006533 [Gymnopus androsaceus JB14]
MSSTYIRFEGLPTKIPAKFRGSCVVLSAPAVRAREARRRPNFTVPLARFSSSVTRNNSDGLLNRVKNLPGYTTPVFTGKEEQRALVQQEVAAKVLLGLDLILIKINHGLKGFIPQELVANEVNWFYTNLGIDDTYFRDESQAVICDHIIALFGAKVLAYTKHDPSKLVIDLEKIDENGNGATFIHTSPPGITTTEGPGAACESRLETFHSAGSISATASQQLRCYLVNKCVFPDTPATKDAEGRTVSDKSFLEKASEKRSCGALSNGTVRHGGFRRLRLERVIGYQMGGTTTFFSALSNLYHFYSLYAARKYVEQFSTSLSTSWPQLRCNGITIISLYLNPVPNSNAPAIEHSIFQVMKETLPFCLPKNPFFLPKAPGTHAVQEATYTYCGWVFAQHFCNRLGPAYLQLKNILDENDPAHAEVLNNIKRRFRRRCLRGRIRLLYVNFAMVHYPASDHATELMLTSLINAFKLSNPSPTRSLRQNPPHSPQQTLLQVLESFLIFNKHILKTNFYQPTKVALSFRLDPGFLPEVEYPKKPFAMFFVDENYNLASTQSLKNKDIPEGGPRENTRNQETLVDLYEKPELLFFGPDEGTADMMDWAALHARDRGAETWWKSFTTGRVPRHSVESHTTRMSTVSRLKAWVLATGTVAKDCKGNCGRPRKLNALDLACLESCIERTPDLSSKSFKSNYLRLVVLRRLNGASIHH